MDDLDRAKDLEMHQREQAIKKALSTPDHDFGEQPDIVDGIHYCIDCAEEIVTERLQIKPDAVRCVYCKKIWEQNRNDHN